MAEQAGLATEKLDRLSSLPDDVIFLIFSFLPMRQTIRLSILSRKWRYFFAWTPNLTIDYTTFNPRSYCELSSFEYFVNKFLFSRRRATIGKFRLNLKTIEKVDSGMVDGWIYYSLSHNVQDIELCLPLPWKIKFINNLPSYSLLFNCKTLVSLKLESQPSSDSIGLKVPRTVCLPKLKVLHLDNILFSEKDDDQSVQRFFSGCHVLEELLVTCCKWWDQKNFSVFSPTLKRLVLRKLVCEKLVINAPSLVYFEHLDSAANSYSLLNLQSLVEAVVDIWPIKRLCYQTAAGDFLEGISNVQSLHISCMFTNVSIKYS